MVSVGDSVLIFYVSCDSSFITENINESIVVYLFSYIINPVHFLLTVVVASEK